MISSSNKWSIIAGVTALGLLVYLLAPVLTPFLIGALFAYLGDPLVDRLETYKLSRTNAVIVVFVMILLVVIAIPVVLLPLVEQQLSALATNLPTYIDWVQLKIVPFLSNTLNVDQKILNMDAIKQSILANWRDVGGVVSQVMGAVGKSSFALMAWLANLVLIPVVTFYLLRDWDDVMEKIHGLIPRANAPTVTKLAKESDSVLGAFLRGQMIVMFALGCVYTVGLWMLGLDLALLIGMVAGIVSFVPYLGFIVGVLLAGVATMMQFGEVFNLVYVLIIFGIGQALEGMLLTPLFVGEKIGLHPVAVIFAVMAGGQLFGFVGVLIALPVAAVLVVLLRHMHELYTSSTLYEDASSDPPPQPPAAQVADAIEASDATLADADGSANQ